MFEASIEIFTLRESQSLFKIARHPEIKRRLPKPRERYLPNFGSDVLTPDVIKPNANPASVYEISLPRLYSHIPGLFTWQRLPRLAQTNGAHITAQCSDSRKLDDTMAMTLKISVGSKAGSWSACCI